jgi:hypothetical protein
MEPHKDSLLSIERLPDLASLEPRQAPPKKRFRIVRLEERIAPACKWNPQTRCVGGGRGFTTPTH